jgi:hypothetical protein
MMKSQEPHMKLSLIKAAEASGKSKSTINRAIKSGKLSAHRNDDGSYSIDPSELLRAFPLMHQGTPIKTSDEPPPEPFQIRELEARLEATNERLQDARERLIEKDNMIADLRSDRDTWRQQASRLLEDHRPSSDRRPKTFWARIFRH